MKKIIPLLALIMLCFNALAENYYVSPTPSSKQKGDAKHPFGKINDAVALAHAGDTIIVLEGIYRERVIPIRSGEEGKPIVFMGEKGKKVVIKGSEIWRPKWESKGDGIYSAVPEDKLFNDVKEDYPDNHNPFKVHLASTPYEREGYYEEIRGYGGDTTMFYTCGQVFVNGEQFKEVPYMAEMSEPKTWHYDSTAMSININFGELIPENQEVEITTRRRIFAPIIRGLGYITVEGFVMEHCGNQYPTNFWVEPKWGQRGALGLGAGHHWSVRRNVIRLAKTFAIDAGNIDNKGPKYNITNNLFEENYIVDNGAAGIMSCQSNKMIIRKNVIVRNNSLRFYGSKRWEHAGVKCHSATNAEICDNYICDNYMGDGIWMDNQFENAHIARNVIVGNEKHGIMLEMSNYNYDVIFIDNNIVVGNGLNPIYCHDSSGATYMHNLLANSPVHVKGGQGIIIHQVGARTNSAHHSIYNNIFVGNTPVLEICYPSHRGGAQRMDCNIYNTTPTRPDFCISKDSDVPYPWNNRELFDLVSGEVENVGTFKPQFHDEKRVSLSLDQWRHFWANHGCEVDKNSTLSLDMVVTYHPDNQTLTIQSGVDTRNSKSVNHEKITTDFFGSKIPQDGSAIPGPFQNLVKGTNVYKVWDGLKILNENQLPDFATFNR